MPKHDVQQMTATSICVHASMPVASRATVLSTSSFATHLRSLRARLTGIAVILMLAVTMSASAQGVESEAIMPLPKNSLYLEVGGSGFIYSINYDRVFQDRFSIRAGAALYGDGGFLFPVVGNYLLGKGASRLELGLGISIISITFGFFDEEEQISKVLGTASFAYRYQKPGGGIFGKVGFTPLFGEAGLLPWFGASIGYTLD